jgi:PAS domain S-box-containing protein
MNDSHGFPFSNLIGQRAQPKDAPGDAEGYEAFIEMLPHAALLVDTRSQRIAFANPRFSELTAYSRLELSGMAMQSVLPEWNGESGQPGTEQTVLRRNQTSFRANLVLLPAAPKGKQAFLLLEPAEYAISLFTPQRFARFWQGLNQLINSLNEASPEDALQAALVAAQSLSGADALAVYRLQSHQPILQRCADLGATALPESLDAQEMMILNRARLWQAGKRPASNLQRVARAAQYAYLASAPIGQSKAVVGLAIIGSTQPLQADLAQGFAQLLAATLSAIFERFLQIEHLQAQIEELAGKLRRMETLQENSQEGVIVLDAQLRISSMSPSAELMMGYASAEVNGQRVENVLIGPEALLPALSAALEGSAIHNLGSARLYRRNGEAFPALIRIFPVHRGSEIESVLTLIKDLSEQEQIRLQTQQLEQRALLGEVTAVFAHEVRNPINNISTGLQVMAMNLPPEDANQAVIARMLQDCDRLAELLKSVLAYAKPTDYEMETLDVVQLLRRLLERLHPRIVRQNVQYDLRAEANCPKVEGNLRALEQVFNNLISNAVQAMTPDGGHLIIKATPTREDGQLFLEISVADTGPGIPLELQDKVFQPFFTTEKGGTGLGLAIVKRILTAHKGDIHLTSFPGGTIFHVRLPAVETTAP